MTIDERLEYLLQSTESLHGSCQELHATAARQSEQIAADHAASERRHNALMKGLEAYLRALNDSEDMSNGDGNGEA